MLISTAPRGGAVKPLALPAAILLALAAIIFSLVAAMQPAASKHGWLRHGEVADQVVHACKENGPMMRWKSLVEKTRFYEICKLEGEQYGLRIIQKINGAWEDITAFIPGDGKLSTVVKYAAQSATRFTGTLP